MIPYSGQEVTPPYSQERITISALNIQSQLTTEEQIRRFELLRLAFFTLKLRKLEQRIAYYEQGRRESQDDAREAREVREVREAEDGKEQKEQSEYTWRCNLLRHAIFQQVVTLTRLNAREQAMQLIEACRR